MHLFIEILTLAFFLACAAHAAAARGRTGVAFFGAMLLLGFLRENFVTARDLLYGAVVWTETVTGERFQDRRPSLRFLALTARHASHPRSPLGHLDRISDAGRALPPPLGLDDRTADHRRPRC
jgi:hypothetical protein